MTPTLPDRTPAGGFLDAMSYSQWLVPILNVVSISPPAPPRAYLTAGAQRASAAQCGSGVQTILARSQGADNDLGVVTTIQSLLLKSINGSTSTTLPYDHGSLDKATAVHNSALLLQEYV